MSNMLKLIIILNQDKIRRGVKLGSNVTGMKCSLNKEEKIFCPFMGKNCEKNRKLLLAKYSTKDYQGRDSCYSAFKNLLKEIEDEFR